MCVCVYVYVCFNALCSTLILYPLICEKKRERERETKKAGESGDKQTQCQSLKQQTGNMKYASGGWT